MNNEESPALNILLVDDNQDLQEVMLSLLESWGHHVTVADEPMRAIDAAMAMPVDVCIVDIVLPGMDGYDLAAKLRKLTPGITIIAMSGYPRESERESACGFAMDHFLQKPFTTEVLVNTLAALNRPVLAARETQGT